MRLTERLYLREHLVQDAWGMQGIPYAQYGRNPSWIKVSKIRELAATLLTRRDAPQEPRCHICGKSATCIGEYETCTGNEQFACDTCCGHGNEDGHCSASGKGRRPSAGAGLATTQTRGVLELFTSGWRPRRTLPDLRRFTT